jgi:hypothetical protein
MADVRNAYKFSIRKLQGKRPHWREQGIFKFHKMQAIRLN